MSYKPKSTYQILETSGDEYYTLKGDIYVGPYILTSEGAFQGNNISRIGPILRKITQNESKRNNIYELPSTQEYYAVNPSVVNFIKQTKFPVATKTKPTPKDYKIGYYTRYFVKKVNTSNEYYEVDKKTYKKIKSKSSKYDYHSFTADSLIWAIIGDVQKANKSILEQVETRHPNISQLFPNLLEFYKQTKKQSLSSPDSLNKTLVKFQHRENHGHGGEESKSVPYIPPKSTQKFLNELEEKEIIQPPTSNSSTGGGGY